MELQWTSLLFGIFCIFGVQLADATEEKKSGLCESKWIRFGKSEIKFFNTPKTWNEAETKCMMHGAHLPSVHSLDEDHLITDQIQIQTGQDTSMWLGGQNFPDDPTHWSWSDGSHFDFSTWSQGQPDRSGHCIQNNYWGKKGNWDDVPCDTKRPFMCIRPFKNDATEETKSGLSESDWTLFGEREFKFFNTEKMWNDAEAECIMHDAHLASVHSLDEDNFITDQIRNQTGQDTSTWLGGRNFPDVPCRWFWFDESPFDFPKWAPGQPNGSGHCMRTNYIGGWDDLACVEKHPFICARPIKRGVTKHLL